MNITYLILSILATWRLTHLLSKEDGPFDLVYLLRKKAGAGFFGSLLDCFYCLSLWIALPFAIWLCKGWIESIVCWWAISGAACLLEQACTKKNYGEGDLPDYKED